MKKHIPLIIILLCLSLTLPAQHISKKKEQKLQNRLQCANLVLLQNEKRAAYAIYKEIRDEGGTCPTALIANDSLALMSFYNKDLEELYKCIKYSEKYLEKDPTNERLQAKNKKYWRLYYDIRNKLVIQEDLCGIWVSDYTEDKHKAPYLILEIENIDGEYIAHLHPTCQVTWKYPTYLYFGKYKYTDYTELPHTVCGILWDKNYVNVHFADKRYKDAHPQAAQLFEDAGREIINTAHQFYNDVTSDPDFYRLLPSSDRWGFYGATMGVMVIGGVMGIIAAILQTAKSYGYSITLQADYTVRGEMECTLTEDVLAYSSATGITNNKIRQISFKMLKVYPDYDVRFIGYNNWLVSSHSFTNKEAKTYPESKYRGNKILLHNDDSYNQLFESFLKSHKDSPDSVKAYIKNHYEDFRIANSGTTFGTVPTSYGHYYGELKNGDPLETQAKHFFKDENSWFIGIVKDNKRYGSGTNYECGDSTELLKKTVGAWDDGKLSGFAVSDDYANHQHFEGYYSKGYRHGKGVLTDTIHNIIYEGYWDDHFGKDCLNGEVLEKNLDGEIVFSGIYEDNHREGHGTEKYWDGSIYEGSWKNGLKHGDGALQIPDLNEIYNQTWKKGILKYGKDIERNQNGDIVFNGEYKNDQRNGYGMERQENGSIFNGYWRKGLKHGNGVLYDSDKTYNQTWKRGIIKHGMVLERNQNGAVIYEGEYRNNKRDGSGTEYQENGNVYNGKWKFGLRHGEGVLHDVQLGETYHQTWSYGIIKQGTVVEKDQNGNVIFKGEYRNNKRDGYGSEYYGNGCVYTGYWKQGLKHGSGVLYIPDSNESYSEEWENGKIIKSKQL